MGVLSLADNLLELSTPQVRICKMVTIVHNLIDRLAERVTLGDAQKYSVWQLPLS